MAETSVGGETTVDRPLERHVLVVDDVLLTREGVAELLRRAGLPARTAAGDLVGCDPGATVEPPPDVVLVNASTVDLAAITGALRRWWPCAVVAFGVPPDEASIVSCIELKLAGFLLADEPMANVLSLIATADPSNLQCPSGVVPILLRLVAEQPARGAAGGTLTAREDEIVRLLAEGLANKQIGIELGITPRTVKNHLRNIYEKLGVHSRSEAAALLRTASR
jgi:DNA-binding NarL/FixJ family response regulator